MKSNKPFLSTADINALDIVDFLKKLGHDPTRISYPHYWYLSPLRQEKTASFKVNRKMNAWWDFGIQQGGSLTSFLPLYYNCPLADVPIQFDGAVPRHIVPPTERTQEAEVESSMQNMKIGLLHSPGLLRYLSNRRINLSVAQKSCREANYSLRKKDYYAIAFPNRSGGYELRNEYFKGCVSPKDITLIRNGNAELCVFEGFMDFLSYQTALTSFPAPSQDYLILNSVSFIRVCQDVMCSYPSVSLFLDNDPAGDEASAKACGWSDKIKDRRSLFSAYKDVNDWLCQIGAGSLKLSLSSG